MCVLLATAGCDGPRRETRRSTGATPRDAMAAPKPFSILSDGSLTVPLHVLHMPNGRLPVPNKTKELLLEIGTNAFDTVICPAALRMAQTQC